ncbi:hypothetical protein KP509_08G072800 [Ceratopteris richardii]|uniref:Large ribosomal subunit protein uL3c n=1 Tax=Ceratopteris richardii TaxID=49495 RepID=A0A8T2U6U0_CERRI|nr:hypothetical protein KP509_08G072800 [Ceratopteris richardii]
MAAATISASPISLNVSSASSSSSVYEVQGIVSTRSVGVPSFQGLRACKEWQRPLPICTLLQRLSLRKAATVCMSYEAGVGVMGNKVGMMTYFTEEGEAIPVTVIGFREGNVVTQVKTDATDGYNSVQIGYRRVRDRKLTKPELGHLSKSEAVPLRHLQEFRLVSVDNFEPGQQLTIEELFKEGDLVDISGNSIGKGFQGGIKRHNFRRGPMTHGSKSHRQLGSIGAGTTPGRVYPGKKMPGRLGGTKTKIRKLKVIKVDTELRTLIVKGAVPGKAGNLLRITPAKIVGKNIPKN